MPRTALRGGRFWLAPSGESLLQIYTATHRGAIQRPLSQGRDAGWKVLWNAGTEIEAHTFPTLVQAKQWIEKQLAKEEKKTERQRGRKIQNRH
jgi:hypothetical protein